MSTYRKTTLKDVAERANVSQTTVSAIFNGKSEYVRVSDATRARVLEIAQQMGYHPNMLARSLRRRRTNIIGIYAGPNDFDVRNTFRAELVGGIQAGCNQHHQDLLMHGTFRGRSVDDIYANLMDGRIDGLIVYTRPDDPLVARLATSKFPVVAVVDAIPTVPSVVIDDVAGAQMLANYLYERGHQRIVHRSYDSPLISVVRRRDAFFVAAAAQGLEVLEWKAGVSVEPGGAAWQTWETLRAEKPSAVACWNDNTAYEMLDYCREQNLRVPEDLAVTGFDGLSRPLACAWELTTIRTAWAKGAQKAVDLLVAQMNGETIPQETVLPVTLVTGDTA
jgi:DNA-binding LacI/PurR family transcriptional regulator